MKGAEARVCLCLLTFPARLATVQRKPEASSLGQATSRAICLQVPERGSLTPGWGLSGSQRVQAGSGYFSKHTGPSRGQRGRCQDHEHPPLIQEESSAATQKDGTLRARPPRTLLKCSESMVPVTSLILHVCAEGSLPGDKFLGRLIIPGCGWSSPRVSALLWGGATSEAPSTLPSLSLCGYFLPCRVLCNLLSSAGAQLCSRGLGLQKARADWSSRACPLCRSGRSHPVTSMSTP